MRGGSSASHGSARCARRVEVSRVAPPTIQGQGEGSPAGLAGAGAAVVVADINGEGAHLVADEIVAAGGKAIAVQVDITDLAAVDALDFVPELAAATTHLGRTVQ